MNWWRSLWYMDHVEAWTKIACVWKMVFISKFPKKIVRETITGEDGYEEIETDRKERKQGWKGRGREEVGATARAATVAPKDVHSPFKGNMKSFIHFGGTAICIWRMSMGHFSNWYRVSWQVGLYLRWFSLVAPQYFVNSKELNLQNATRFGIMSCAHFHLL